MAGIFSKIFGGGKSNKQTAGTPAALVTETLESVIEIAGLDLQFDVVSQDEDGIRLDVYGNDEEILTAKDGQLLDAFQLLLTRVTQHQFSDQRFSITVDNSGYREEANQQLIGLADKLKGIALDKGKPVYFRALPPRDRKVIHQYLADDGMVKSRSVGEGLFKKIKIVPLKGESTRENTAEL